MKLLKISWRNYRGLADGEINAQGSDVTISGRNGVGKSSIASVLSFVLFGGNGKSFDDKGLVISEKVPDASVEFDTVKLRRMVTPANKSRLFIDDTEISATKFNQKVSELTKSAGVILFNPFEFPTLNWKAQRDFLLANFTDFEEPALSDVTDTEKLRSLKKQAQGIPFQIEELDHQLDGYEPADNLPIGEAADDIKDIIKAKTEELDKIHPQDFAREEKFLREKIADGTKLREDLLKKFRSVKTTCPTCGQQLPTSKVAEVRESIIAQGKRCAQWLEKYRDELESLQSKMKLTLSDGQRAKKLQDEIRDLNRRLDEIERFDKLACRRTELLAKEKTLNAQIVELEGRIAAAQKERQSSLVRFENHINRQFEHVKFKLFKVQVNGEVKPDCAAMLDGVPYTELSKGEKLKAALDIFRTLQKKFNVEMPLFIDDAESYTPNSFVALTNQLFLFKVTDTDLTIEIQATRAAA